MSLPKHPPIRYRFAMENKPSRARFTAHIDATVTPEMLDQIDAEAERLGLTRRALVRLYLGDGLRNDQRKDQR